MQKRGMISLAWISLKAHWRLRWAESRHDGAVASVEHLEQQLADARLRAAATAQDLGAAQGAEKLARDAAVHHQVLSGMGLR